MLKTNRAQVLKALVLLATDEGAAMNKVRTGHRGFKGGGFGVLFASFFLAFNPSFGIPCWIIAVAASFGGALVGLAAWFENSLVQWPVIKEFLDLARLRKMKEDVKAAAVNQDTGKSGV